MIYARLHEANFPVSYIAQITPKVVLNVEGYMSWCASVVCTVRVWAESPRINPTGSQQSTHEPVRAWFFI